MDSLQFGRFVNGIITMLIGVGALIYAWRLKSNPLEGRSNMKSDLSAWQKKWQISILIGCFGIIYGGVRIIMALYADPT